MQLRTILILILITPLVVSCRQNYNDGKSTNISSVDLSQLTLEQLLDVAESPDVPDSLVHYVRRAVNDLHYSFLRGRRCVEGLACLDSLERESEYVREHCRYELLSGKAGLNQLAGRNAEALRFAHEYEQLPANPDKNAYIREMEIIGGVYMYCGNDIQNAITTLEHAVEAYRQGGHSPFIIRIISRLGSYYRMTGEYEKAAYINQEAIGSYEDGMPAQNVVIAYGEQSNLYGELGIFDRALDMNKRAQFYSLLSDSFGLGDLYRYRADLFLQMADNGSQPTYMDSVFHYLRLAGDVSKRQRSYKGVFVNNIQLAAAYMQCPDSVQKAVSLLRIIAPDTVRMPQWVMYEFCQQLGTALCLTGDEAQGISLIRRASSGFASMNMLEEEFEANKQLMSYYQKHGERADFMHYYTRNQLFCRFPHPN